MKHQRLELPQEVTNDNSAVELISVWYASGKARVLTRSGLEIDKQLHVWGKILSAIEANIAEHAAVSNNMSVEETKRLLRAAMDDVLPGD